MNQLKVFTVKEANDLLPSLTPLLQELKTQRDALLKIELEIDTLEIISEKNSEGVSPAVTRKVEEYTRIVNRFYAIADAIQETGCVLKDVDTGLVDFYSLYHGKVVYLCWRLGEPDVACWHEIGSGFSNRQPIEDAAADH